MVKLTKDGHFVAREYVKEDRTYIRHNIETAQELLNKWPNDLILESGTTVRSLLTAVSGLTDFGLIGPLVDNYDLAASIQQGFNLPVPTTYRAISFTWVADVEDSWVCDNPDDNLFDNADRSRKGPHQMDVRGDLSAIGPEEVQEGDVDPWPSFADKNGEVNYSLTFTALNEIIDLPLIMNPDLKIWDSRNYKVVKETPLFETTKAWTVGDVLTTFFYNVGIFGSNDTMESEKVKTQNIMMDALEGKGVDGWSQSSIDHLLGDIYKEEEEHGDYQI